MHLCQVAVNNVIIYFLLIKGKHELVPKILPTLTRMTKVNNTPLSLTLKGRHPSHSHVHFDLWMRLVSFKFKVLHLEVVNGCNFPLDPQLWEGLGLPLDLLLQGLAVVAVHMSITKSVHKVSRLQQISSFK